MKQVAEITEQHMAWWRNLPLVERMLYQAPVGMIDCGPAMTIQTLTERGELIVRVPWKVSPHEAALLAAGGTLWVSVYGNLPPHSLEVQPP